MQALWFISAVILCSLSSQTTLACQSDMECKGDRVCDAGQCVVPTTANSATSPDWKAPPAADATWARQASLIGYVGAAATLGLAVGSYSSFDDQGTSIALGGVATLVAGIAGPIAASGGTSARTQGAFGNPVLQSSGWVAYTLSMLNAVTLIALSVADVAAEPWLTLTTGSMGAMGLVFFAMDAQQGANELDALKQRHQGSNGVKLTPMVAPWITRTGIRQANTTGAVAGVNILF
jgi:hypothetical protein